MAKAKYVVTMRVTGPDYEEIRGFFGRIIRRGSMAEVTVEADDPETAKAAVSQLAGSRGQLIEAKKV